MTETVRLGGMALRNGVLVHGPTSWGLAVRDEDGALRVASGKKPRFAESVSMPFLRGRCVSPRPSRPARRAPVAAAGPHAVRPAGRPRRPRADDARRAGHPRSATLSRGGRELVAAGLALLPAAVALREPGLAEYHGAEHVSIGTYENGASRAKEHPRCGSQLIGPLLASLAANAQPRPSRGPPAGSPACSGRPRRARRGGGGVRLDEPQPGNPSPARSPGRGSSSSAGSRPRSRRGAGRGRGRGARRVPALDVSPCRPSNE